MLTQIKYVCLAFLASSSVVIYLILDNENFRHLVFDFNAMSTLTVDRVWNEGDHCSFSISTDHITHQDVPFKIFIYELPSDFNSQLSSHAHSDCHDVSECGYGPGPLTHHGGMSIRNTWQFALEIIIHMKLLASPYRTLDPSEADAYYIPFYVTLQLWHNNQQRLSIPEHNELANLTEEVILKSSYYKEGKLHIMALAMPLRMMRLLYC